MQLRFPFQSTFTCHIVLELVSIPVKVLEFSFGPNLSDDFIT